ncbi:unnamed protein product [Gongylonema pulchrum]|uniref:Uncharacterized protein n=1 Tax=Gongylonema pulchrum TaxID=637853 RepID=A0A3P7NZ06_9BILA|nr:unnamed protein product [Gongylonema pulchrum]
MYPTVTAAAATTNPLISTLSGLQATTPLANQVNTSQAQQQQQYIDYATLAAIAAAGSGATAATAAAAAAQANPFSLHPTVSAATGLEQYAYTPYGLVPANSYAAQLSAAQSQLAAVTQQQAALEHQRV